MSGIVASWYGLFRSPIGELVLVSDGEALTGLNLPSAEGSAVLPSDSGSRRDEAAVREAIEQLEAYFSGDRTEFDLTLRPAGTPFQRSAWEAMLSIPFGETISYAEQARRMGRPGAARAVGAANGRNPIAIVIPCHRVIGSGGTLTGYGGGLPMKQWLLDHESTVVLDPTTELAGKEPLALAMRSSIRSCSSEPSPSGRS